MSSYICCLSSSFHPEPGLKTCVQTPLVYFFSSLSLLNLLQTGFPSHPLIRCWLKPPIISQWLSQMERSLFTFYLISLQHLNWFGPLQYFGHSLLKCLFPWTPLPFLMLWPPPPFLNLCSFLSAFWVDKKKKSRKSDFLDKAGTDFSILLSSYCDYQQQQTNHQPFHTQE